jgi:hypothetical protein
MAVPKIDAFRFGHIVIDGQLHNRDVIILPDQVVGGWWRREGHALYADDLKPVFDAAPEILIVGQGVNGRLLTTQEVRTAVQAAGIGLIALPTEQACQVYNKMRGEGSVAAALHLTC